MGLVQGTQPSGCRVMGVVVSLDQGSGSRFFQAEEAVVPRHWGIGEHGISKAAMAPLTQRKELGGAVMGHKAGVISRGWIVKGLGHCAGREQETKEGF